MLAQLTDLLELRGGTADRAERPVSPLSFDWIYTILMLMFTVGFMMDVWSHDTFGPDQSVLNEYHLLFYTSAALMGALLVGSHFRNVGVGYRFENALPIGYGFAFLGIIVFGIAGGLDLVGHALFGFENTEEALLSPSHLGLFIGWGALSTGPMFAMIARSKRDGRQNLLQSIAGIISTIGVLVPFSIMLLTVYLPMGQIFAITQWYRGFDLNAVFAGFFTQTALLFAFILWLIRSVRLPLGALTLLVTLYTITVSLPFDGPQLWAPVALMSGLTLEIIYFALQPDPTKIWRFRIFGFLAPVGFWLAYFSYILIFNIGDGFQVTNYMWGGIAFQTGLVGFGLATLMTLAPAQAYNTAKS